MKKVFLILSFIVCYCSYGQLIPTDNVIVGGGGDYTNQPFVPQAKFSRTQTLYYPDQLKFQGEITGLRFYTPFSNSTTSPSPNTSLVFKIGHTTKEEFVSGDGFIPDSELTEIGISTYYANAYEYIVIFDESFNYNGIDNLVIDVEDINPGYSTSALAGWRGTENFNNPPTRSRVSITEEFSDGSTSTSVLLQNSYAKTRFDGNLEECETLSVTNIDNVTNTSAEFTLNDNSTANHYRYVVTELGEEIPETYDITNDQTFSVSELLPSQDYYINVKTDCDAFGVTSGYRSYYFKTRPDALTVPYTIDFESDFLRDYAIPSFGAEINTEAANLSTNGLMFFGPGYPQYLQWVDYGDPFEENTDFLRTFSVDVDLTQNAINPLLRFDISQTSEAYLRVKVKPYADDNIYTGVAEDFIYNAAFDDNEFKTVSIDLSEYVGEIITIKLEHVSKSSTRKTYLDNIQFIENDCENISNISSIESTNSISINWDSNSSESYEVIAAEFEDNVGVDYLPTTTNSYAFTDLSSATSYKLFVRNICGFSASPWQKTYTTTDPEFLQVGFDNYINNESSLGENLFAFINSESSKAEFINYFSNERLILHQRDSNAEWVGGDATTEVQAWNDNKDFLTGLKFKIDGTTLEEGEVDITFRQLHHYSSTPANSWFRILINGTQYGPSYNPTTRYQDPLTTVNIDLQPYLGDVITFELQHVGRTKDYFSLSAIGGDGAVVRRIAFTGSVLSISDVESSSVELYPNPASTQIYINGLTGFNQITIFDVNGRSLKTFQSKNSSFELNISEFNTGMYFAEIESDGKSQIYKFIKL
ncbi:T9SS type A sorting domain-containing protein [Winogradskyella litoriviva]|uniref:T9SS type A sorting domain-containing protein n=1 Tax=Winogradskyella litoriviva TaxID=1220182 RepID=A0ABX2E5M6_9FLAO|nr:T9SS type A sorting domain-containing protein [Winogradskyella litoriviva]NRD23791.1 T9SS type A sorting domain-containing protein [Winogradskyella litoriviva]